MQSLMIPIHFMLHKLQGFNFHASECNNAMLIVINKMLIIPTELLLFILTEF